MRTNPTAADDQSAERGDALQVAGDPRLVAVDVIADQREQRGDEHHHRYHPPSTRAERHQGVGFIVLHTEENQLLLADRLALLDEEVAPAVGVVNLFHAVAGDVALTVRVGFLVGQASARRRACRR